MSEGYRKKDLEAWKRTRLIAYCNIPQTKDNPISIWDFLPLEDDPTPEELQEMKKQRQEQGIKRAENILKRHRENKKKRN